MAWTPYPGFSDQTYQCRSANIAVDRCINVYPSRVETNTGKGGKGLIGRPGLQVFSSPSPSGTGRGLWAGDERLFAVVGSNLFEISSVGVATLRGSIGSGSSPVHIASNNGSQLAILNRDSGVLYVDNGSGPVAVAAQPALFSSIAYLDGYLFGSAQNANAIFQSDQLDFTTWDPLDQATSVAANDRVARIFSDSQSLIIAGRKTTQFWYNAGALGFALERIQGSFIQEGTSAPESIAAVDGIVCMLTGSDRGAGRVVAVRPGRLDRISTYAIEWRIQGFANTGEAVGYGYQSQGHSFYAITFPSAATQFVYDFAENAWHERFSGDLTTPTESKEFFHACTFDNRHFVQERANGIIRWQRETLNTDDGVAFQRIRTAPILYTGKRMTYHAMRTDQQIGNGLGSEQTTLEVSLDGGLTYGSPRLATNGGTGQLGVVEWRSLGQAGMRGMVAKVSWPGGSDLSCMGAMVDVREDLP